MRPRRSNLNCRRFRSISAPFALLLAFTSLTSIPEAVAAACTPETTLSGSYTIVVFKTVGSCTWSTPGGTNVFRGLIVAGGGGGGSHMGGGGGGGGYVEFESLTVTNDVLTITVGDGGAGGVNSSGPAGTSGGNSTLTGSNINLVSRGGAGGASVYSGGYPAQSNGGSGGGAAGYFAYTSINSVGTQTSQSQTPSLASILGSQFGGDGSVAGTTWYPGGGGGAGGNGANSPGNGGAGRLNSILGVDYYWAGGGGGSGWSGPAGTGGIGGGGGGGYNTGTGSAGGSGYNSGATGTYIGGAGGANTGGGGGAGTYSNYAGAKGGSGIVVLRYLTFASPTSFTSSAAPYTKTTSPITFSLTFSQSVDSVTASDFSNAGTATGCAFSVDASSGTSFTLTATGCSEGTLIPQVLAGSVYGSVTGTNGPSANSPTTTPVIIDRTAPTFSVMAPSNATYVPTNTPTFTATFSESVTVTGMPRLVLTVGSQTKYADFLSMSDSKTALFRYTVGAIAGEFDTDGIAVSTTLDLNGGAIADIATNALSPLTFTAPTLTSVLVAQKPSAPTIDSITATSGQLAIYFTAGASNGSTITNYEYSTNNGGAWTVRSPTATTSPLTITGLANGTGYTVRLRAINAAGSGDSSTAVTETPTAIAVSGDASLTLTYGNSASTGSFSATGGTNTYTWSLGSSISGVTLSGTTVTASNTLGAGTYTQTVRATDGNSQVGSKTLTITVNKASTSISIALPNSSSNAALGGVVTITATVPRAGAVNFKLGGTTISGCSSAVAASTSATCSWTPGSLGSVSLTAIFTPTDSSNYETSTTTTLSITVVNGVSSVTLSLTGGVTEAPKSKTINIIAAVDQAGKLTILIDGKRLAGCFNKSATIGNVTCSWKPAVQKQVTITASLNPTNNVYNNSSSSLKVWVVRRSGAR